jgi:AhpC/TSA family
MTRAPHRFIGSCDSSLALGQLADLIPCPAMIEIGSEAPDFTVDDHDGQPFTLSTTRGHWVLLWWYPKADTPG